MAPRPPTNRHVELQAFSLYRQHDKVEQYLSILREHDRGSFRRSAELVDECLTDDRMQGVVQTRQAAIKAAPFTVEPAGDQQIERQLAEELAGKDKRSGRWSEIVSKQVLGELLLWGWFLGIGLAQICWRREARRWTPYLEIWHPRWIRWDMSKRRFVVQTENHGEVDLPRLDEQPRGDGQWFVWLPYGMQGWTRGLIRSLGLKYLSRQWNERDWDRYNEVRSMGILKGTVPSTAKAEDKQEFYGNLRDLGGEPVIITPVQVASDGKPGAAFNVEAVEFTSRGWETMRDRKAVVDTDVAVLILGQNLTTEVKEGSRAAAGIQNLVRLDRAMDDAEIGPACRTQILTWDAQANHGDAEIAPWPTFNVEPPDDEQGEAQALKTFGEGLTALKAAEPRLDVTTMVEARGYPLISEEEALAQKEEAARVAAEAAAKAKPPAGGDGEGADGGGVDEDDAAEEPSA